jgi:hypothetical protein
MLTFRCPETDKTVQTSLAVSETDLRRLGTVRLSLWCPHCQAGHNIAAADTTIDQTK